MSQMHRLQHCVAIASPSSECIASPRSECIPARWGTRWVRWTLVLGHLYARWEELRPGTFRQLETRSALRRQLLTEIFTFTFTAYQNTGMYARAENIQSKEHNLICNYQVKMFTKIPKLLLVGISLHANEIRGKCR